MTNKNGGIRPGSGRPRTYKGEKTKLVRIPESQASAILDFLDAYRRRGNAPLTTGERFAYEIEIRRLKQSLLDAIAFLKNAFRPIPSIHQKINDLQHELDKPRPVASDTPPVVHSWEKKTYTPAGAFWQLSATVTGQHVVLYSAPPPALPSASKSTHLYQLSLEDTDALIAFLLSTRPSLKGYKEQA